MCDSHHSTPSTHLVAVNCKKNLVLEGPIAIKQKDVPLPRPVTTFLQWLMGTLGGKRLTYFARSEDYRHYFIYDRKKREWMKLDEEEYEILFITSDGNCNLARRTG